MDATQNGFSLVNYLPPDLWASVSPFFDGETLGRIMLTGKKLLWAKLRSANTVRSIKLGNGYLKFKSWPAFLRELPSIEELYIDSGSIDWWLDLGLKLDDLPPTLKYLKISGITEIDDIFLRKEGNRLNIDEFLPNLESIELQYAQKADYTPITRCPPTLTKLGLRSWDGKMELPSSLLHFTAYHSIDYPIGAKLPPQLETLDIPRLADQSMLIPSLTSFSAYHLGDMDLSISPESLACLPMNLTELDISDIFPASSWSYLPPNLQKLTFTLSEELCATITRQVVDTTNGIIREVKTYPFELLPKSLTSFKFYVEDISDFSYGLYLEVDSDPTSKSNPIFPPNLRTLQAQDLYFSPNAAKQLPASLTELQIENLSEAMVEYLPKRLTHLTVIQTLISPKLISLLPKSLFVLQLHYAQHSHWFDFNTGEGIPLSECPEFPIHKRLSAIDWRMDVSFPPNLTALKLVNFRDFGDSPRNFNLFNLLTLDLSTLEQFSDTDALSLSCHLTELNLSRCSQVMGKWFPVLPRSLLRLELRCASHINDDDIQHLPRTLEVAFLCDATSLTDRCIVDFPRHLRMLDLSNNTLITQKCIPDLPYPIRWPHNYFSLQLARWRIKNGKIQQKF